MSQGQPLPASTILLIEADPSLRRLITLGLYHHGMHVIEARSIQELSPLDAQILDLLIVDVDQGVKSDWSLLLRLREQTYIATLPIVALSWDSENTTSLLASLSSLPFLALCTTMPTLLSSRRDGSLPQPLVGDIICLSKPFDARTLHSTIAKLLVERTSQKAAQVALVEAQVLASYEQHAAPSIWPVLTAAGLLLTVMGLLLHFLVALVGVMLVLAVLLLWTLGEKPTLSVPSSAEYHC